MKKIFMAVVGVIISFSAIAQADYTIYEDIYPGCVDNQASEIYYPNKWNSDLNLPEFPGGDVELSRFIFHNIEYPDVIDSVAIDSLGNEITYRSKGVVLVQFIVDRCGRTQGHEIVQSVNEEYDNEALRITQNLPVFKPGAINGERVKVALIVPVHFTRNNLPKLKEEEEYYEDYYY